jgi:YesN/AraC family two-component response regulator
MSIFAAASGFYNGAGKLAHAYHEALEIISYKQFVEDGGLSGFTGSGEAEDRKISASEKRRFCNLLLSGDIEGAKNAADDLIEKTFPPEGRLMTAQLNMYIIKDMLVTGLSGIKDDQDREQLAEERILNCKTVNELRLAADSVFYDMMLKRNLIKTNKDRITVLLEYLESNFGDPLINVSTVTDKFKLDRYYATKEVKKRTGYSLLDYIHKLRLEKAKQLLLENRLTISQIAGVCGFTNAVALNRVFQKYEGIAAGKYRKISKISSLLTKEN